MRTRRNTVSRKNSAKCSTWFLRELQERYDRLDLGNAPIVGFLLLSPKERIERYEKSRRGKK